MNTQKELLKRAEGIKASRLAKEAGVTTQTVYNWRNKEDSKMFVEHYIKIHEFLISIGK